MPFCPICKSYHDPDLPCFDRAQQMLRNAGVESRHRRPGPDFKKTAALADRFMLRLLISVLAAIVVIAILAYLLGKLR